MTGICDRCGAADVDLDETGVCADWAHCTDSPAAGIACADASVAVPATEVIGPRARQEANDIAFRYGGGYILEWTDKGLPVRRKRRDSDG